MRKDLAVVFLLGSLGAACAHGYVDARTTTTAANVPAPINAHAIETLAVARCMHAASCDDVGLNKRYATYDACLAQSREDGVRVLATTGCTDALDDDDFDRCLADVRAATCDATAEHLASCSTAALCRAKPANVDFTVAPAGDVTGEPKAEAISRPAKPATVEPHEPAAAVAAEPTTEAVTPPAAE